MCRRVHRTASIVTIVMVVLFQYAGANFGKNNTQVSLSDDSHAMPIVIEVISNIGVPGAVLFNRNSESVLNIQYSLNCSSNDTIYTILATTTAEKVAKITASYLFDVTCSGMNVSIDAQDQEQRSGPESTSVDELPLFIGTASGYINMTVKASMIGRSFLLFLVQRVVEQSKVSMNVDSEDVRDNTSSHEDSRRLLEGLFTTERIISKVSEVGSPVQVAPVLSPDIVGKAMIIVMQLPRTIDEVFRIVLYVVIVLATTGMGVKVDLAVIKQVLMRPTAPIIGLCCQYICMPLIAYVVAKIIPQDSAAISLGIFACGIVPGGGPSNMFSYLLGGDLSLSVTMTTLSNIAALGLLPLWIFTLGDTFKDDTVQLHVPYEKILEALAIVILPLFLGIFIKFKLPKIAKIIGKILKPVLIIIVAFTITFGIYINIYIFEMIQPMTIVAGCLLPYIGYLLGGFIAFLCFCTWSHIKTIAIETGIQNTSIAFLILYMSLPPPDNQLAAVGPASSAIMTPLPLFVAVVLYILYHRLMNKRAAKKKIAEEKNAENGNIEMKDGEAVEKALGEDDIAAIVLVWQKLTGRKSKKDGLEILNKELELMKPEK